MRTFNIVLNAPFLDDHLGLPEAVEEFAIHAFVPKLSSVVLASLQATAIVLPCACSTSIGRSFVTICSAQIILLGAEFTWIYAKRYGSRKAEHSLPHTKVAPSL